MRISTHTTSNERKNPNQSANLSRITYNAAMKTREQHLARATTADACRRNRGGILSGVVFCLLVLFSSAGAHATVLLSDTFADGDRLTQNLPTSAHWYTGGPSNNSSADPATGLTFQDASAAKATAMAYFSPTELQIGQTMTLSFDYKFQTVANSDNAFMFGLYNSGGSYATKDSVGFNNAIFNSYTGYATSGVFGVDPSGPGRDHIESRDLLGHNLLSIGTYSEGTEYKQSGAATPGTLYAASMQITRTATGVTVESKVGNTDMVQQYTGEMFTSFDSVGIFSNGDTGSFTVNTVTVNVSGAPEPSSVYAVLLLAVMVFGRMFAAKIQGLIRRWQRSRDISFALRQY